MQRDTHSDPLQAWHVNDTLFLEFALVEAIASSLPNRQRQAWSNEGRRTAEDRAVTVERAAPLSDLGEAPCLTDPSSPVPGAVYPAVNQLQRQLAYRSTSRFGHMSDTGAADSGKS